jgi:hypothetical protein
VSDLKCMCGKVLSETSRCPWPTGKPCPQYVGRAPTRKNTRKDERPPSGRKQSRKQGVVR